MTADAQSFWTNHLSAAVMLLRQTEHRATGISPFTLITGLTPTLPTVVPPSSHFDDLIDPSEDQLQAYADVLADKTTLLHAAARRNIHIYE